MIIVKCLKNHPKSHFLSKSVILVVFQTFHNDHEIFVTTYFCKVVKGIEFDFCPLSVNLWVVPLSSH